MRAAVEVLVLLGNKLLEEQWILGQLKPKTVGAAQKRKRQQQYNETLDDDSHAPRPSAGQKDGKGKDGKDKDGKGKDGKGKDGKGKEGKGKELAAGSGAGSSEVGVREAVERVYPTTIGATMGDARRASGMSGGLYDFSGAMEAGKANWNRREKNCRQQLPSARVDKRFMAHAVVAQDDSGYRKYIQLTMRAHVETHMPLYCATMHAWKHEAAQFSLEDTRVMLRGKWQAERLIESKLVSKLLRSRFNNLDAFENRPAFPQLMLFTIARVEIGKLIDQYGLAAVRKPPKAIAATIGPSTVEGALGGAPSATRPKKKRKRGKKKKGLAQLRHQTLLSRKTAFTHQLLVRGHVGQPSLFSAIRPLKPMPPIDDSRGAPRKVRRRNQHITGMHSRRMSLEKSLLPSPAELLELQDRLLPSVQRAKGKFLGLIDHTKDYIR
jgi:hypothetical protein